MKYLKWLAIIFVVGYLGVGTLLYVYQDSLLFHPMPRPAQHSYGDFAEETIELPDGETLNATFLPTTRGDTAAGVILYLHGNRGDNGRSLRQTDALSDLPYDRYLVDYRGFGKSTGTIRSDLDLTEDLQLVYDQLKRKYREDNIVILGYSLGSGPATYLAANNRPRGVVLAAPYTSLVAMKNEFFWMYPDFLIRYELNNSRNVAAARVPIRIVHGAADRLIPVEMSRSLRAANPDYVTLDERRGVSHRGAIFDPAIRASVEELIEAKPGTLGERQEN